MSVKRMIYLALGFAGLGLGAVGAVLPFLPSVPFLIMATFFFGKSSESLDRWFKGTKLYKKNIEDFVEKRGMTLQAKIRVVSLVSLLMLFGFIMMKNTVVGRIVLAFVWIFHLVYFAFGVKTLEKADERQGRK